MLDDDEGIRMGERASWRDAFWVLLWYAMISLLCTGLFRYAVLLGKDLLLAASEAAVDEPSVLASLYAVFSREFAETLCSFGAASGYYLRWLSVGNAAARDNPCRILSGPGFILPALLFCLCEGVLWLADGSALRWVYVMVRLGFLRRAHDEIVERLSLDRSRLSAAAEPEKDGL